MNQLEDDQAENGFTEEQQKYFEIWKSEQLELKQKLILKDCSDWNIQSAKECTLKHVGGLDISFDKDQTSNRAVASLIVMEFPSLKLVYQSFIETVLQLPYIPSFLGFREIPSFMQLIEELLQKKPNLFPQVIMVDGNGINHPRGFGSASHFGVVLQETISQSRFSHLNIPQKVATIGVAKNVFVVDGITRDKVDTWRQELIQSKVSSRELLGDSGTIHGHMFLSGTKQCIFVSPGNNISLSTALEITKQCCKFKIPEPIRQADLLSRKYIAEHW